MFVDINHKKQSSIQRFYSSGTDQPQFSLGDCDFDDVDQKVPRPFNSTDNYASLNSLRHSPPLRSYNCHYKEKVLSDSSFEMEVPDFDPLQFHGVCQDSIHGKPLDDYRHIQSRSETQSLRTRPSGRRSLPQLGQTYSRKKHLPPIPSQRRHFSGSWTSKDQFFCPSANALPADACEETNRDCNAVKNMFVFKPVGRDQPNYSNFGSSFIDKISFRTNSDNSYLQSEYASSRSQHKERHHLNFLSENQRLPPFGTVPKMYPPIRKHAPRRILPDVTTAMKRQIRPENLGKNNRSDFHDMKDLRRSELHCDRPCRSNDTFSESHSDSEFSDLEEQCLRDQHQATYLIRKNSLQRPKYQSSIDKNQHLHSSQSKTKLFSAKQHEKLSESPANSSPVEYESEDNQYELRLDRSHSQTSNDGRFRFRNIRSPISSPEDNVNLLKSDDYYQHVSSSNNQHSSPASVHIQNSRRIYNNKRLQTAYTETWT